MPSRLQQQADDDALLGNSGSQRMFLPWQAAGLQAQAAAAAAVPAQPFGELLPQWQTVSDRASMSVLPSMSGPAEAWGADGLSSFMGQQEEEQEAEQRQRRRFRLSGGDQRYSAEARSEAALALDLLVSLLLAPQQGPTDVEGLRYVRWACRLLHGGRPPKHSSLWPVYRDALEGLRWCQQGQWPPVMPAGQPPLGRLQQEPPVGEAAQQQAQPQEAPQQQPQPAAVVPAEGAAGFGAAAAGGAIAQPQCNVPGMQSLCAIAGEVAEELARTGRTQPNELQRPGLPSLGGGTAGGTAGSTAGGTVAAPR
jgi:hypothetical protein